VVLFERCADHSVELLAVATSTHGRRVPPPLGRQEASYRSEAIDDTMDTDEFVGLARRWPVLDTLRGGPLDRRDLQERVGVSRPTIHRQLRTLGDEGLVAKRDGAFELTPVGELAATAFARVFEAMDTVSALSRIARWLPVREFGFDLDRLRGAEIVLAHPNDPLAPTRRMLRQVHGADDIRIVTYSFLPEGDPATRRCFVEEHQSLVGVLDPGLLEAILADPASAAHLQVLLAGGAHVAVATDPVPFILTLADETVLLGAVDEGGSPQGLIVTDDEVIRTWAEDTVEGYLDRADRLTPEAVGAHAVAADGGV
jgi:predicted transcriptional regulator